MLWIETASEVKTLLTFLGFEQKDYVWVSRDVSHSAVAQFVAQGGNGWLLYVSSGGQVHKQGNFSCECRYRPCGTAQFIRGERWKQAWWCGRGSRKCSRRGRC